MTEPCESIAVGLFQLGGPDSLEAVEPFLFNLFSDPDIIDFPFARLARPTLARLISSRRARHVQQYYASIGGKSPIRELTERQRTALERELRETRGLDAHVFVAMRYWHPLTEAAAEQIPRGNFREVVLLPLYPQYSRTTTGSSLNEWHRRRGSNGNRPLPTRTIHHFYDHPAYLDAIVQRINEGLARFRPADVILSPGAVHRDEESLQFETKKTPRGVHTGRELKETLRGAHPERELTRILRSAQGDTRSVAAASLQSPQSAQLVDDVWLVFSAHGVPVRVIEAGDPYQRHIEETVRLVMERGRWSNPHVLCWQSRVSPGKWLEPTLNETLRGIAVGPRSAHLQVDTTIQREHGGLKAGATEGGKRVLVVPVSFVTDHVETLAEIDIEARHLAQKLDIEQFELMPALNDSPTFIRALADLVVAQVERNPTAETQRAQR